jgi:hypothetical protein
MSRVTVAEWLSFTGDLLDRLVQDVGDAPARWQQLLDRIPALQPEHRAQLRTQLEHRIAAGQLASDGRIELWNALRAMVAKYRTYSDAEWALPDAELAALEAVTQSLQPTGNTVARHAWLFTEQMPDLGVPSEKGDYAAYAEHLATERAQAVAEAEQLGFETVRALAAVAVEPGDVGLAIADAAGDKYRDTLLNLLASENQVDAGLAWGWLVRRFQREGWPWTDTILAAELTPEQKARALLATRDYPGSWEKADEFGTEVATAYWRRFSPYGLGDFPYVQTAAERLGQVGRVAAALRLAVIYAPRAGDEHVNLLISVLRDFLNKHETDPETAGIRDYDFRLAFDHLHTHARYDQRVEVAQLEWAFLPVLGFDPRLDALEEALATEPGFFSEVLDTVYRPDSGGEGEDSDGEQAEAEPPTPPTPEEVRLATNGYQLLRSFRRLPGLQPDNTVDEDALRQWITRVLDAADKSGRQEIAELEVGRILAYSPEDPDGAWPCEAVRKLLQELQNSRIESGLQTEVVNRRGVTSRGLEEGGRQESELAEEYRAAADRFADTWPQTASVLRSLAGGFDADARREEREAEQFRRGIDR